MEQGIVIAMGFVGLVGLIAGLVVGSYHRSRTIRQLRRQMRINRRKRILNKDLERDPNA
jgi:hypothetical protein